MKNWKYIKVGNYDAQEKLGLKPVPKTIQVNEHDKKTILEIYEKAGKNYDRAKRMIKEKFIGFDDNAAKTALESVIGTNGKGLNESIFKQEASMFQGLKKDAEKEIGNAISDYSVITTKDGYFVYKKGQKVGGPFQNEEQAKAFAAQLQTKDPQWANKIGNKAIYDDSGRFIIGYVEKNGNGYSAYTHGITGSKSYLLDAKDEKTAESELKDYVKAYEKRTGNKAICNASLGKFLMAGGHTATLVEEGGKFIVKYDDGRTETFMTRKAAEAFLKVHSELYIGNTAHSDKVEVIKKLIAGGWSVEDIYKMLKTEGYEVEKSFIERLKTGNETKAEEKFGKVMGEFEEGALKTPQGKTVTDPAQAKAIAYSEADKVDNLKRARNAMKCGNEKVVGSFEVDVEKGDEEATIEISKGNDGRWTERIVSGRLSDFRSSNYMSYLKPRDIIQWLKRDFDYVGSPYNEDYIEEED